MDFAQLSLFLVIAASFGALAKYLKQPIIVGYLFAGIFLAITGVITDSQEVAQLGKVGVALLLFLLGLEMNPRELKSTFRTSTIAGLGQIVSGSIVGFLLASVFGRTSLPAIYIALAITFSSTIVVIKLLSEKKELNSLYGKSVVGMLLIQDVVAVFLLIFLSGIAAGKTSLVDILILFLKGVTLFVLLTFLSKSVLPKLFDKLLAASSELLFTASIAWALGFALLVAGPFGLTVEIGGFLAGLALSNIPEHFQIAARTRPLRDFFLTLFFMYLGTQLVVGINLWTILLPAIVYSLFVLVIKPLLVIILMEFLGYKRRTAYLAAISLAQISEFSFILMSVGLTLNHITQKDVATIVLVGVITMLVSTYLISSGEKVYKKIEKYVKLFERKHTKEHALSTQSSKENHIILVGCDRTGQTLRAYFLRNNIDYLVIDFNPVIYSNLTADKVPAIFGDINDTEILEAGNITKAKMIITTFSKLTDNLALLSYLRNSHLKPLTLFTAASREDALRLYENGATYVLVPEVVAGEHLRHLLDTYGTGGSTLERIGKSHYNRLLVSK